MGDNKLTHVDAEGAARMVDVSGKAVTARTARARCKVLLAPKTFAMLTDKSLPKGEALGTARIAGIQAAKKTAELIPLCHPLPITFADVRLIPLDGENAVEVESEVRTTAPTGVEMEALVAAQIAAATLYDMVKAVQKDVRITDLRVVYKCGGKSGEFVND